MHYKVKVMKIHTLLVQKNYGKNPAPDLEPSVYGEFMSVKVAFKLD